MRAVLVMVGALCILSPALLDAQPKDPHIVDTPALAPAEQAQRMKVPPGFLLQLIAAEPTIKKPINIAFDAMGRLWVTGSEEYPFPAPPGREPKDKLVILEDFGPDGRARKATTFAEGLNIPIGVLPLPDCKSAIVFSIPNIYRLDDTDGDGKADQQRVLYSGYGFKDTHGMTGEFMWGFDGWIYCCHGFANTSNVKSQGGDKVAMQSGNTYRIKPDGSKIEQFTWGQVNPFGLAFDEWGNLYSADCHTRPIYQLLKGGYYPSFGKPHDGLGFAPEMMTHDHGSTGIAGVAYTAADYYPPDFRNNLFIGNVITNRVNRDRIEWHGSSPKAIAMPDFVVSEDRWFRPVDIKLGPDGALYVADFYNRIIGHYEVPLDHPLRDRERGRIWRVVNSGPDGKGRSDAYRPMPERTTAEVIAALDDPNLTVRTFATNELVRRNPDEVAPLLAKATTTPLGNTHALWVLERIGRLDDKTLSARLASPEDVVRVHALRILAERERISEAQRKALYEAVTDVERPRAMRAAAEALGAHPAEGNVYQLLNGLRQAPAADSHLRHTLRMALRDQYRDPKVADFITRAAFREAGSLEALAEVSLGIPSEHAAEFLLLYGLELADGPAAFERRVHHVARHGTDEMRPRLLDKLRAKSAKAPAFAAAGVMALVQATQERGAKLTDDQRDWATETVLALLGAAPKEMQTAIELAGAMKLADAQGPLLALAADPQKPEPQRKSAVAALVGIEPRQHIEPLSRLLLSEKEPIGLREQVAASLAAVNHKEAHAGLVAAFEKAPGRLQTAIALGMASSPAGANQLLEAVAAGKASARLLQDPGIHAKLRQARIADLDQRLAKLTRGLPPADQRAEQLMKQHRMGYAAATADARKGVNIFQKHCGSCHQINNQGAKVGPQLDGIGIRGVDRLLEDIFDPNRNIDQAFRATTLELDNGQFVTGLLLREEGKVLVLADKDGKEVRVPGEQVASRVVTQLSPMPANFAEQIAAEDFYHLLAYLLEQRVK